MKEHLTALNKKFEEGKIIVIKIGSSLLSTDDGKVHKDFIRKLGDDIAHLKSLGKQVVVVSSGSVALGKDAFLGSENANIPTGKMKLEEKQAASSCGQVILINAYNEIFTKQNIKISQILITARDFDVRNSYLNINSTLHTLLEAGITPIINENDTITTEELRMGENDGLAARVASMCEASLLFLLSDVDGIYSKNPNIYEDAKHLPIIKKITKSVKKLAGDSSSSVGSGGMHTKVQAAEIAFLGGCSTIITKGFGEAESPIKLVLEGKKQFSIFYASAGNLHNKKRRWLAGRYKARGKLFIDAGAKKALLSGNSLLPVGVKKIEGNFLRGDVVQVCDIKTKEKIATGLSEYPSSDAERIIGKSSDETEQILGYVGRDFIMHRDNMMMHISMPSVK